jgi:hypothetical protein
MLPPELKARIVARAEKHERCDGERFASGAYESRNGIISHCSIGCVRAELDLDATVGNHGQLVDPTGVPELILILSDYCFENLDEEKRIAWTRRLWSAIPTSVDLAPHANEINARLLDRLAEDAIRDDVRAVSLLLAALYRRRACGDEPSSVERDAAWHQADAAWHQAYAARQQADAAGHQADAAWHQADAAGHQADAAWHQADAAEHQAYAARHQAYAARQQADAAGQQADAAGQQAYAAGQQADAARQGFWSYVADAMVDVLSKWRPSKPTLIADPAKSAT